MVRSSAGERPRLYVSALFAAVLLISHDARAAVTPVSDAERALVQIAAAYLSQGPEAVYGQLSATSPLRRLPQQQALDEIEVRLGPPSGATWTLQTVVPALKDSMVAFTITYPSGVDENAFFTVVKEGADYRVAGIRTLSDPAPAPQLFPPLPPTPEKPSPLLPYGTPLALGAAVIIALAASLLHKRAAFARIALVLGLVAAGGALFIVLQDGRLIRQTPKEVARLDPASEQLSALLSLRRALAAGASDVGSTFGKAPQSGAAATVARIWKAEWDLRQMRVSAVKRALAEFPRPSRIPAVELVRARLALLGNDREGALTAYHAAMNLGPGRDALWVEYAGVLELGGADASAKHELQRIVDIGSRDADIYYARAFRAATAGDWSECEAELRQAWQLRPVPREDLVGTDVMSWLMRRRGPSFITLSAPDEAAFASPSLNARAIPAPPNSKVSVSGDFLRIDLGQARLEVPGGSALAPAGAAVVDAASWARNDDERVLGEYSELAKAVDTAAAYMQPVLRVRALQTADVLERRNRWADLAELTRAISPKSEFVPTAMFFSRARALRRLGRGDEAKHLLADFYNGPAMERLKSVRTLSELGDEVAALNDYDLALKIYKRARVLKPDDAYLKSRTLQIAADNVIASAFNVYKTDHFEIHYAGTMGMVSSLAIGKVLEGELQRLQPWVPVHDFHPVIVNIISWPDFKAIYTGNDDILGFYNGSITLPLAGITEFEPEITSIVTHELCHAMVAQMTKDQAPHWFQEGLAQRVEMGSFQANAFNMYDDDKLVSLSTLDSVIVSAQNDPEMVAEGYIVSETFIRYLEAKFGHDVLRRLMASFATGASTEQAVEAVSGVTTMAALDKDFRTWGRSERRVFEGTQVVEYHMTVEEQIQRATPLDKTKLSGGAFRRTPQP